MSRAKRDLEPISVTPEELNSKPRRKRSPRVPKSTWRLLSDATFELWNIQQKLLEGDSPEGVDRVRMISSAQKSRRLAAGIEYLLVSDGSLDQVLDEITGDQPR